MEVKPWDTNGAYRFATGSAQALARSSGRCQVALEVMGGVPAGERSKGMT
jgi:hypothetical protein